MPNNGRNTKNKTMLINEMNQSQLRSHIRQLNKKGQLQFGGGWADVFPQWVNGQVPGFTIENFREVAEQKQLPPNGRNWPLPTVKTAKPAAKQPIKAENVNRAELIESLLSGVTPEECAAIASRIVEEKMPAGLPTVKIIIKDGKTKKINAATHEAFPRLLRLLSAGEDTYCYGPAGTGKTELGKQLAEALDLNFYFTSKISAEHHFQGFVDGSGKYHETPFFKAFTRGGLFLFDEMDASNPNVLTRLNAALANRRCDFPNGIFEAHKDFICLGAGNTALGGASREYNARQQQDSALVDRFLFVPVNYDESLELQLASAYPNGKAAAERVQSIRAAVKRLKIRHTVSMRATIKLAKLLAYGETQANAESAAVWKALDSATITKIETNIKEA